MGNAIVVPDEMLVLDLVLTEIVALRGKNGENQEEDEQSA
jgi:hypothetical protein